jgi:hypothetical protein
MAKKKVVKKSAIRKGVKKKLPDSVTDTDGDPNALPDPEGLDEDRELGDFPIDTLLIRNETRSVFEIVRRIEAGGYIMNPEFQRDFVWDRDRQSKLIESVVMRIPLPVFYLAEDPEGRIIVVDGLQRLTTFQDFLANKFRLKLPEQLLLNGKKFKDLSPKLQNRIEDCNLILYILDSDVPDHAKFQIFERVNGGVPLTRQQMRNCLYSGRATKWLKDESETDLFLEATGNSLDAKKMRDRELINRFCDGYLASALQKMNRMSDSELHDLSATFRRGLKNNFDLFGRHAFRKHAPGQDTRSILNASLWDVMMTGLARFPETVVQKNAAKVRTAFYQLLDDGEFNAAITYGPNSVKKVEKRFQLADAMFREVLDD